MPNFDREKVPKIAEKYDLEMLLLFGSRAGEKKHIRPESDFDVAYLAKKDLDLESEAKMISDLMPVFGSEKVDLVNIKRANPLLMKQVFEKHKMLFCSDSKLYHKYLVYSERKFEEAAPLFKLRDYLFAKYLEKHA